MRRREFITLLGGGATAAWPLAARAQQSERMRRIGVLTVFLKDDPLHLAYMAALREGLQRLGWLEGRNIRIEYRWAAPDAESLKRAARELVALKPDLILTQNTLGTASVLQQSDTIPVVFVNIADPVGSGFVASFPRPGGNATGFLTMEPAIGGKWLELLREIAPGVTRVALLFNPATATYAEVYMNPFKAAASSLGVEGFAAPVGDIAQFESVIEGLAHDRESGFVVMSDPFFNVHRVEVAASALRHRLPAVYPWRSYAEVGGLLSYGNDLSDNYLRAATYVDRILRGANPNELPVQAPVKYELVINAKTAKALGITVPLSLSGRADEVIE